MELRVGIQLEKRLGGSTVGTGEESCCLGSEVLERGLAGWPGRWAVARHVCFRALTLGVRWTSSHVRTGLEGPGAEKTCSREIQASVEPLS